MRPCSACPWRRGLEQITEPEPSIDDKFPAISPDGKTLLRFNRQPTFYFFGTLYTVRLDENAKPVEVPKPIPSRGLLLGGAVWTEDREGGPGAYSNGLYRIPAEGTGDAQPVPGTSSEVKGIALSRQGNRLAYAVVRGDANVWRIDLTARVPKPERLIASTFRDVYPQYSPDGSRIAFQSTRGEGEQIWVDWDAIRPVRSGYLAERVRF